MDITRITKSKTLIIATGINANQIQQKNRNIPQPSKHFHKIDGGTSSKNKHTKWSGPRSQDI